MLSILKKCINPIRTHIKNVSEVHTDGSEINYSELASKKGMKMEEVYAVEKLFKQYDSNKDGVIDRAELQDLVRNELGRSFDDIDLTKLLRQIDKDRNQRISFDEFLDHMALRVKPPPSTPTLLRCFHKWDKDKDGLLNLHEVKQAVNYMGLKASDGDIKDYFRMLDESRSGKIDFHTFELLITRDVFKIGKRIAE